MFAGVGIALLLIVYVLFLCLNDPIASSTEKVPMNKKLIDIAERTLATAAEAGLAYAGTRLVDVGPEWVLIGTPVLAAVKGWIATHWGNRSSASTAPSV